MKKYLPVFTTDDLTTDEKWATLRKFIENWYDFEIPNTAYNNQLTELEKSFPFTFPLAAERFFTLANQLQSVGHIYPNSGQKTNKFSSIFRDGLAISFLEKHQALSLLLQAEQDIYWAIETADFKEENPKVYSYFLDYESDNGDFERYGAPYPSVTSFVLKHMLTYLNNCSSFGMQIENMDSFKEKLKSSFVNHIIYDGIELFEDENIIAYIDEDLFDEGSFYFRLHLKENRDIESLPEVIIDVFKNRKGGWTSNRFNDFC